MITIECKKGLPVGYELFLIEKYESYVATCRYVEIFYSTLEISHMLVFENGKLIDLFMFGNDGKTSKCFNYFAGFDQAVLEKCIKKQFEEYPAIKIIEISASYRSYNIDKSVLLDKTNDYILDLPTTMDDYCSELGQTTRKSLKKQKSRLLKDYPKIKYVTKFRTEIDEAIIEKITQLNIDRMKEKGVIHKSHFITDDIYRYCQHYGLISYLEVDDEIVAGTISCIINKGLFGLIVGHNSKYSRYSVGIIIQLNEIQTCIDNGISTLHFMSGEFDYKKRLLGKPHLSFSYLFYRYKSFDFIYNKSKAFLHLAYIEFKHLKLLKPVREFVKLCRRKFYIIFLAGVFTELAISFLLTC